MDDGCANQPGFQQGCILPVGSKRAQDSPHFIHPTVVRTAREWGLEVLHKMALLCFVRGTRQPALVELAQYHARHNQKFPLAELTGWVKSFAPIKRPKPEQIEWARSAWADIVAEQSK